MSKLISIIIPVYNHAEILPTSIASIFMQSHRPLEVIVIDDGSTDNFKKVIEIIKRRYDSLDIEVIYQTNKGAPTARNNGFKASRGDYLLFWDADVVAEPNMLEKMKNVLEKDTDISYVYSNFKFGWKNFICPEFNAKKLKSNNYIHTSSLIRRKDFPLFDESLKRFQDWDLWLTMFESGKIGKLINERLFKVHVDKRGGISKWLPKFIYNLPWETKTVKEFNRQKKIVLKKHNI